MAAATVEVEKTKTKKHKHHKHQQKAVVKVDEKVDSDALEAEKAR